MNECQHPQKKRKKKVIFKKLKNKQTKSVIEKRSSQWNKKNAKITTNRWEAMLMLTESNAMIKTNKVILTKEKTGLILY